MNSQQKFFCRIAVFFCIIISLSALPQSSSAKAFSNPLIETENAGCLAENLRKVHFSADFNAEERLKICRSFEKISLQLSATIWSPMLSRELSGIWQIFSGHSVVLRRMPEEMSANILAMADPLPAFQNEEKFAATIYLQPQKVESDYFLLIMIHELRHIYDFYEAWAYDETLSSLEVERHGFLVMGKVARDSGLKAPGFPKFWSDKWRTLSEDEIALKSAEAVDKHLASVKQYRYLFSGTAPVYDFTDRHDFTEIKANVNSYGQLIPVTSYTDKHNARPEPPSNSSESNSNALIFDLEKPHQLYDETVLLRVALENEKKLAARIRNLIYDQKTQFQCLEKGKVVGTASNYRTDLRAELIDAVQPKSALLALKENSNACADEAADFKSELTDSFWAQPDLDKMEITFCGYVQIDNRKLVEYSVIEPALLATTTKIFKGKIYVSPEDDQIVRFYGTSSDLSAQSGALSGSAEHADALPVIAIRQKLNIDSGVWVTSYIASVAADESASNLLPYRYTTNFQNFRRIAGQKNSTPVQTDLEDVETVYCGDSDDSGSISNY